MNRLSKICLMATALLSTFSGVAQGDDFLNFVDDSYGEHPWNDSYGEHPWNDSHGEYSWNDSWNDSWNGNQFFIRADALYWKAHQEGLEDAVGTIVSNNVTTNFDESTSARSTSFKKDKRFDFDWRGGYRIGCGYTWCQGWTLEVDWTHYRGHAQAHDRIQDFDLRTCGRWNLNYDVLDVIAATPYYSAGSCFLWNIFGGVRAAHIDQKVCAHTESISNDINISSGGTFTTITDLANDAHNQTYFRGIGPEIGVNGNWALGCGLSIYGNASGAILFGRYHSKTRINQRSISQSQAFEVPITFESDNTLRFRNGDHLCEPVIDLGLGFHWQKHLCYCNHQADLMLKLGWEHHQWFDHDHLGNGGDLCLDGLIFSVALSY